MLQSTLVLLLIFTSFIACQFQFKYPTSLECGDGGNGDAAAFHLFRGSLECCCQESRLIGKPRDFLSESLIPKLLCWHLEISSLKACVGSLLQGLVNALLRAGAQLSPDVRLPPIFTTINLC